jgi:hypothetical protein
MRTGHELHMVNNNTSNILSEKRQGKRPLERSAYKGEDNIMDLRGKGVKVWTEFNRLRTGSNSRLL